MGFPLQCLKHLNVIVYKYTYVFLQIIIKTCYLNKTWSQMCFIFCKLIRFWSLLQPIQHICWSRLSLIQSTCSILLCWKKKQNQENQNLQLRFFLFVMKLIHMRWFQFLQLFPYKAVLDNKRNNFQYVFLTKKQTCSSEIVNSGCLITFDSSLFFLAPTHFFLSNK